MLQLPLSLELLQLQLSIVCAHPPTDHLAGSEQFPSFEFYFDLG
jgi:hypothetical protein